MLSNGHIGTKNLLDHSLPPGLSSVHRSSLNARKVSLPYERRRQSVPRLSRNFSSDDPGSSGLGADLWRDEGQLRVQGAVSQ